MTERKNIRIDYSARVWKVETCTLAELETRLNELEKLEYVVIKVDQIRSDFYANPAYAILAKRRFGYDGCFTAE